MSEGEHPYVERLEKEINVERRFVTEAENEAYWTGWRDRNDSIDELQEVRKIACALLSCECHLTTIQVAENAWAIWRAIKAGQEGKP